MSTDQNHHLHRNVLFDLKGYVALVTGGGSGIGLMIAQTFAANGAKVYITGRTSEKLKQASEVHGKDLAGHIIPIQGDVTKKEDVQRLVDEIGSREEHLCILVNNAGIAGDTFQTEAKTAEEMKANLFDTKDATYENWTNVYQTLVSQMFFTTIAFLPLLAKSTEKHPHFSGTVINITSISGMVMSSQHHPAYNAAKSAAIHLNRMLAAETANNGIKVRINSLAPGLFPSEMTAGDSDEKQKSHLPKDKMEGKVPAQRPGKEEDMASAALFFVVNQYLNGQNVAVDGGYTLAAGL